MVGALISCSYVSAFDLSPQQVRLKVGNVSSQAIPVKESLSRKYLQQNTSWTFEHQFGMCLAGGPLHGTMTLQEDADWLIEWFEINRMFGVTEFNFPNATLQVSPKIQQILEAIFARFYQVFLLIIYL